jgi:hypothetical protein
MKTQVNIRMSKEAVNLLRKFSNSRNAKGQFLERLLFEHAVRLEERMRFGGRLGEEKLTFSEEK